MATSVFMKADEVQELLGVSRSEAYRIMKKLNGDLKEKGFWQRWIAWHMD